MASESGVLDHILTVVEYAAVGTEVLAVTIIVAGIVTATYTYVSGSRRVDRSNSLERDYRQSLGRTLLLGLEVLVAADVVRTVALEPTIESAAVLGILVLIRTFLSWSLVVEIESRWPWQRRAQTVAELESPYPGRDSPGL